MNLVFLKNEILYGIVSIEVPGYGTKKFRVHDREMLEGPYEKLQKSTEQMFILPCTFFLDDDILLKAESNVDL